jgi:OmpA-OmpF porin, OOP family
MRYGVLLAAGALTAVVPTLLLAQQRPASAPRSTEPPSQRPAAPPAPRPLMAQYAGAQREHAWELSVGVGALYIDKKLSPNSQVVPGGAVRIGYNINEMWNISVGTGLGFASSPSITFAQPFAAITWTPNINKTTSPFITVGGGGTYASFTGGHLTAQYGGHVGVGIRHMIGENVALRVEGRVQYENFKESYIGSIPTGAATVGLSFFAGGGPGPDSDGDGVPDKFDRCPGTPRGAVVDARGCPTDSDHDGVPDGIDQCPNTPAGVRVDALGCPLDSDHDGVPDLLDKCPNTPAGVQVYTTGVSAGCPVDSDGDGVPDYLDRCPNTPKGAPVDPNGCSRDSDGDGVPDYLDRCPNTPVNARPVDPSGCPVDSDHDGVPDYLDRCASTPPNVPVDANGCPVERDSDGDGVPDSRDKCPGTPHGVRVDADGCTLADLPAAGATLVLENVTFRPNRAELLPAAMADLDRIAIAILATPSSKWEIGGYTSSIGQAARNRRLSQQRADAVKAYLVARGVPAGSLTAVGYGATHPAASNRTAAGRMQNMRVEIKHLQ